MDKFKFVNIERSRIKVFEPFEDVSKLSSSINAMKVSYGFVYKKRCIPLMKGSRLESIEATRKEFKQLLDEGWRETSIFKNYF